MTDLTAYLVSFAVAVVGAGALGYLIGRDKARYWQDRWSAEKDAFHYSTLLAEDKLCCAKKENELSEAVIKINNAVILSLKEKIQLLEAKLSRKAQPRESNGHFAKKEVR